MMHMLSVYVVLKVGISQYNFKDIVTGGEISRQ
jgi:hypothetical protein